VSCQPNVHPPLWKLTPLVHWQLLLLVRVSVNVPLSALMQQEGPAPPIPLTVSV
jgi:hypothetical protein